ncbi:MAG: DUF6034 family protein [Eubacteriales bacterium]|nr:DUF6034 family protein [Eubacteriales bacterium]
MKKKGIVLPMVLVSILTLSAFQKTPDAPIIANKKDGNLEKAILSKDEPKETLNPELEWKEQLTSADKKVTISVDAAVEGPEVSRISVVSCMPHYFTLDETKNAIKIFYGDTTLYDNSLSDKDWLETEIIKSRTDLEYLKRNSEYPKIEGQEAQRVVLNLEEEIAWLENKIARLEADYQTVLDESEGIAEIELKENENGSESVNVRDSQLPPMQFYVFNDKNVNDSAMGYEMTGSDFSSSTPLQSTEQLNINISRKEAEQKALEVALSCGIPECKVMSAAEVQINGQSSYVFTMGRLVGGVPSMPVFNYDGTRAFGTDGEEYREPWRQENIQVAVNDKGVVGFLWEYPPEILKVLNQNVALLSYNEIKEIAKNQLQRTQTADEFELNINGGKVVEINRIVFSMMRVAQKGSQDSYYYLPVWDFLGKTVDNNMETQEDAVPVSEKSFLTINAIDGTIIDRGLGY